ncbi:hypothetical protein QSJ18_16010 [Gordonia sp. ABSL1-1]|uniref:hypothetical protein n=1 Tax=Gordonia sp. ABSL1-1 TaxID=3053923 RepID=UPI002572DA61|nr:hypothetical protein [Gordonia sp. ABSL1-1]MDL9938258.1 hypothetical protein [Gordonia sp. ABSL1-1]
MLPTLWGRIQTRVLVLGILGGLWTIILAPFLPDDAPLATSYQVAFTVLVTVIVLGIAWEFLYHLLQQFRWEKDWPTLFGLLTAINEGIAVWLFLKYVPVLPDDVELTPLVFCIQFISTWLLVWIVVNGPLRVPFPHWRFQGGRFF